ncbi:MAG: hypothetical protein Q8Q15_03635 [bacterium]|nr:hypothetical protein [bacterium]
MLEFPHMIIGATIATKIGNPFLAFPIAFVSNFLLDLIPHWNPHLNTEMKKYGHVTRKTTIICLIDGSASFIVGTFLALRFWPDIERVAIVFGAIFLAVIADLSEAPYFFLGARSKYFERIIAFQKRLQFNVPVIPGIIVQIVFLVVCFWILFS